jgi:hypothetical protein
MKTQSYVGGIAYDSYKKTWTVAEILTHDGKLTGVVHHPRTKREDVLELHAEMLEKLPAWKGLVNTR